MKIFSCSSSLEETTHVAAPKPKIGWLLQLVFAVLMVLSFSGCGPEILYSHLSESDANTMMGLLLTRNIHAQKIMEKEDLFSISVPRDQFAAATDLLKWFGIPGEKFSGIGEVFKKTGIVSSPSEEKIRFMYALSQQISETLSHIDGVLIARVALVLPKNDPYTDTLTPSSASVFLKFRPGSIPPTLVPQIKTLVMKSVEGLEYDNVSVVVVQSENIDYYYPINIPDNASLLGIKVERSALLKLWLVIAGFALMSVGLVIGLILGIPLIKTLFEERKKRKEEKNKKPEHEEYPEEEMVAPISPAMALGTTAAEKAAGVDAAAGMQSGVVPPGVTIPPPSRPLSGGGVSPL